MILYFLTAASCPEKTFYTKKGGKKAARKAAQKLIPEPVLLLS